jgi:hypothetical protein
MPTRANGLLKNLGKIVCDNADATELLKSIYCKAEAHATEILELATLEQLLHLEWTTSGLDGDGCVGLSCQLLDARILSSHATANQSSDDYIGFIVAALLV